LALSAATPLLGASSKRPHDELKGVMKMANEQARQTGPAAASSAGRVLRDPAATADEKSAAGSALAQAKKRDV
jgi:hypothetical protein